MYERIAYERRLSILQKKRADCIKGHLADQAQAKADHQPAMEMERIVFNEIQDRREFDDEIYDLQFQYIRNRAQSLLVPLPEMDTKKDSTNWERSDLSGKWRLNKSAMLSLRAAVREADEERWHYWSRWVPIGSAIISALLGFLGLLVAILALRLKH